MKPLISISSILFFLSCAAQAPAMGGPKDIMGPVLISVIPIDGSTNISSDTKIIFEFDETIDPTSVKSSITILGFEEFSMKIRSHKIIIEPNSTWPENRVIQINMSRRIRDYQNNTMARGHQFIFSTGESIPKGSIAGGLDGFNSDEITQLLLFTWPISDSSTVVKIVESDLDGRFEFLHLPSEKYIILATESRSTDPSIAISKNRYGMIQSRYIPIEGNQHQKIHIYMDEPIQHKKIISVNQMNPQFGYIEFSDGSKDEVIFSTCNHCTIVEDTLTISFDVKNRLEKYTIGPQSFLFEAKLDTISPAIDHKYWDQNNFILHFSEPIQLADSIYFESKIDSMWNSISFSIVNDRDIRLSIDEEDKIRFWGTHVTDFYNNQFQDSLVEISIFQKVLSEEKMVLGGNINGMVECNFINEMTIVAQKINSTESTFVTSNDGKFKFINLEPGKYILKAFENKNDLNSEIYFSGVWNPYKTAATYAIYDDTLDVRSRWDIEGINFKMENFIQE